MKQIFRRKKNVAVFTALSVSILLVCGVLSAVFALQQNYTLLIPLFVPAFLGILFVAIALIEYRGSIEIDHQKVKFNYRIFSKSKELNQSGVVLFYSEIETIRKVFRNGDGIVSQDCFLYTIHLISKKQADVYL